MIKEIKIHKVATYTHPTYMHPLHINFVYGSNGSGKSTLTNFLNGNTTSEDSDMVWENDKPLQVLAYNKNFVETNFASSSPINGVFTLGEDSKEAQDFIKEKRSEVKTCEELINGYKRSIVLLEQEINSLDNKIDNLCWIVQQKYGTEFSDALTGYRGAKRTFRDKCLKEYSNINEMETLDLQEIRVVYRSAFGENRSLFDLYPIIEDEDVKQKEECPLLTRCISGSSETPIGKFIEFLNNSDWVKKGIIYSEKAEGKCPYCQQVLPATIQNDIAAFFDETYERECADVLSYQQQYESFMDKLVISLQNILEKSLPILNYDQLKSEIEMVIAIIESNKRLIEGKINAPSTMIKIDSISPIIERINKIITKYNKEINNNNQIVQNQAKEKERCKKLLWKYFANDLREPIKQFRRDYEGKKAGINSLFAKIKEQVEKQNQIQKDIEEKEAMITSVTPTVNAINGILRRFGFEGFYIEENSVEKGTYKIVRPDGTNARKTLSEGEYNFITFLYFYHLVYGSQDKTKILDDKVVIVDDPISSLDSNVLFIVTTLIRGMLQDCRERKNGIEQIFIFTHNVYFHKEVTFLGSRDNYPTSITAFWVLKKTNNITEIIKHEKNPIQTSYELLWDEIKDINDQTRITVFNTLRRILEYYFNIIGGMNYEQCINKFEGEDKIICKALIACINEGSHFVTDDFVMCYETETLDNYLRVFRMIFEKLGHSSHYHMMMGDSEEMDATA
jgi:wobble nucleotide-excising tRNase